MKVCIVGPVASGKSTLARQLSQLTGTPCFHLDEIVHAKDPTNPQGNRKRPVPERDRLFQDILAKGSYILEDTGRSCFVEGMKQADQVVLLDVSPVLRRKRVITRWLRQRLGLESCSYRPSVSMLCDMFRWSKNYETGADGTRARAEQLSQKLTILRTRGEIAAFLRSCSQKKGD